MSCWPVFTFSVIGDQRNLTEGHSNRAHKQQIIPSEDPLEVTVGKLEGR